ncbi:hypothetical protein F4859DRAFT_514418 [Xylaria cf. heliscus]|nr:hypothetical protein F4859DRAFT_514418 [Xylaria cf. heliscus]
MAEEVIHIRGRAAMAQAALNLAHEAQANFRNNLRAKLDEIARDTEKKLEAFRRQQLDDKAPEQDSNRQPGHDDGLASRLLGANADILLEYHLLREDEIKGSSTVTTQENPGHASPDSQPESIINISDALSDIALINLYPDSDDTKSWLRDSDGQEENGALSQQGIPDPSLSIETIPSLIPNTPPPLSIASGRPRKSSSTSHSDKQKPCQKKATSQKPVSRPGRADKAQRYTQVSDSSDSDIIPSRRRGLPPKSCQVRSEGQFLVDKGKGLETYPDPHRRRSLAHPTRAAQPAGISRSPINPGTGKGWRRGTIPKPKSPRELARDQVFERLSRPRCSPIVPAIPLVPPATSQQATIKKGPVKVENGKGPKKNSSPTPQGPLVHLESTPQSATTSKNPAGLEKDKDSKEELSSSLGLNLCTPTDRPLDDLDVILARMNSKKAASNRATVEGGKKKVPEENSSSTTRRSLVPPVSASQPITGRKRPRSPSAHTPQQSSRRRRQPPRSSVTPVSTYNDKRNFRNMMGTLEGPEHRLL